MTKEQLPPKIACMSRGWPLPIILMSFIQLAAIVAKIITIKLPRIGSISLSCGVKFALCGILTVVLVLAL